MRPLLDNEKYAEVSEMAEAFLSRQGNGHHMHRLLWLKSFFTSNWVTSYWTKYAYLGQRSSLLINSSVGNLVRNCCRVIALFYCRICIEITESNKRRVRHRFSTTAPYDTEALKTRRSSRYRHSSALINTFRALRLTLVLFAEPHQVSTSLRNCANSTRAFGIGSCSLEYFRCCLLSSRKYSSEQEHSCNEGKDSFQLVKSGIPLTGAFYDNGYATTRVPGEEYGEK